MRVQYEFHSAQRFMDKQLSQKKVTSHAEVMPFTAQGSRR